MVLLRGLRSVVKVFLWEFRGLRFRAGGFGVWGTSNLTQQTGELKIPR